MNTILELTKHLPIERSYLIEYLHCIQDEYHCISRAYMEDIAKLLSISLSEVFEVATFYPHFQVVEPDQLPENKIILKICDSLVCQMHNADALLIKAKAQYGNKLRIMPVACLGRCQHAPVALLGENPIDYADETKLKHAIKNQVYQPLPTHNHLTFEQYKKQSGYQTLLDCVANQTPESVIEILKQSGLRGLGGAGFPGGIKWQSVREELGEHMLLINIDESEVGTFKDRYYLESNPHQFIEGALIAAWAINADNIYLYLRNEYANARQILINELAKLNTELDYPLPKIHLRRGAGAYICGEESAMTESIEGKRGMPRLKPPRLSQVGLFGLPTLYHFQK
jgi:formate dehydrogenase